MFCRDAAAARWTGTLPRTAGTFPRHVRPYQLLSKSQVKVLLIHGWTTPDVKGVQDEAVRDRDVQQETEDVLVILHALPPYMVASSKVIVVVDPAHVLIV